MKICLPPIDREQGGSGTFRRQWREWLTTQAITWTEDLSADYDVLFVNAWQTPYGVVYRHKQRLPHLRVVQRVDGAGKDYGRTDNADLIQQAVNTLADTTIFQSDYSRYSTMQKFSFIHLDGPTIYNPVNTSRYAPLGDTYPLPESNKPRLLTVSWSANRNKGTWRLPQLAALNPDLDFYFAGRMDFDFLPDNLHHLGTLNHQQLPALMRSVDVFLNLSLFDPCPNVVIEALASGLPILYVDSGGTPELVGEDAGLPVASDEDLRPQFDQLYADLAHYQQVARQRAVSHFDKDIIFPQYLALIEKTQRRPMPSRQQHLQSTIQMWRRWVTDKLATYGQWRSES